MTSKERDTERLHDILDACNKIQEFTSDRTRDEIVENAVIRQIAIIGEAASRVSRELRQTHQHIPWSKLIGMRNILVHDYAGTSSEKVWEVVDHDAPQLKNQVAQLLAEV